MIPRVLLANARLWSNIARLAIAFKKAGFAVYALAPSNHPIHRMRSPDRTYVYRPSAPETSLRKAIEASRPNLVIPCDDRTAGHLRRLHAHTAVGPTGSASISSLIEDSIGLRSSFAFFEHRGLLADLGALPDVHVAETGSIENIDDLYSWADAHGLPAVLKLDGTWGGNGVVLVADRSAIPAAYRKVSIRRGILNKLKDAAMYRDFEPIYSIFRAGKSAVSVQKFVNGGLANCAIACWKGQVLASIAVEVVQGKARFGNATVIRRVEGREMIATAVSVVAHLKISGLYGFDFVKNSATGQPVLIEINPRATQIDHLSRGSVPDLPLALHRAVLGRPETRDPLEAPLGEIALFPGEWQRAPQSPYLSNAYHDVPFEEPELLKYYGYNPDQNVQITDGRLRPIIEKKS